MVELPLLLLIVPQVLGGIPSNCTGHGGGGGVCKADYGSVFNIDAKELLYTSTSELNEDDDDLLEVGRVVNIKGKGSKKKKPSIVKLKDLVLKIKGDFGELESAINSVQGIEEERERFSSKGIGKTNRGQQESKWNKFTKENSMEAAGTSRHQATMEDMMEAKVPRSFPRNSHVSSEAQNGMKKKRLSNGKDVQWMIKTLAVQRRK